MRRPTITSCTDSCRCRPPAVSRDSAWLTWPNTLGRVKVGTRACMMTGRHRHLLIRPGRLMGCRLGGVRWAVLVGGWLGAHSRGLMTTGGCFPGLCGAIIQVIGSDASCPPLGKVPTLRCLGTAQPYMPEEPALLPPHKPRVAAALCCALAACGPTGVPRIARGLRLRRSAPFHPHPRVVFAPYVLRRSSAWPAMHPAWNASETRRPTLSQPGPRARLAARRCGAAADRFPAISCPEAVHQRLIWSFA